MILSLKISTFIMWIVCTAIVGYVAGYIKCKNNNKKNS